MKRRRKPVAQLRSLSRRVFRAFHHLGQAIEQSPPVQSVTGLASAHPRLLVGGLWTSFVLLTLLSVNYLVSPGDLSDQHLSASALRAKHDPLYPYTSLPADELKQKSRFPLWAFGAIVMSCGVGSMALSRQLTEPAGAKRKRRRKSHAPKAKPAVKSRPVSANPASALIGQPSSGAATTNSIGPAAINLASINPASINPTVINPVLPHPLTLGSEPSMLDTANFGAVHPDAVNPGGSDPRISKPGAAKSGSTQLNPLRPGLSPATLAPAGGSKRVKSKNNQSKTKRPRTASQPRSAAFAPAIAFARNWAKAVTQKGDRPGNLSSGRPHRSLRSNSDQLPLIAPSPLAANPTGLGPSLAPPSSASVLPPLLQAPVGSPDAETHPGVPNAGEVSFPVSPRETYPSEQETLDWGDLSLADAVDMRKRRSLTSWI